MEALIEKSHYNDTTHYYSRPSVLASSWSWKKVDKIEVVTKLKVGLN